MTKTNANQSASFGVADEIEKMKGALTSSQVAEILQLGKSTIQKHAKTGYMPSFKIRAALRFDPQALAKWLRDRVD